MTVDRANRALLAVLGLLAAAAGVAVLVASRRTEDGEVLLRGGLDEALRDSSRWLPWVAIAVGLVAVWAGLLWLRAQIAPVSRQVRQLELGGDGEGRTLLDTSAATDACEAELVSLDGVEDASVRVRDVDPPQVVVGLAVARSRGLPDRAAVRRAVDRLCRVVGLPDGKASVSVTVTFADDTSARVV